MHPPSYYRDQAVRARRLATGVLHHDVKQLLDQVAQDYDDIAEDLEIGAIEIKRPELMRQLRR